MMRVIAMIASAAFVITAVPDETFAQNESKRNQPTSNNDVEKLLTDLFSLPDDVIMTPYCVEERVYCQNFCEKTENENDKTCMTNCMIFCSL